MPKPIIYTLAESINGMFPQAAIADMLQKELQSVEKFVPDCFGLLKEKWEDEKSHSISITPSQFERRLAEIELEQLSFGNTPTNEIEGLSPQGIRLRFTVGEKMIAIKFMSVLAPDEEVEASQIIPRIKHLISNVYPQVKFTDVTT